MTPMRRQRRYYSSSSDGAMSWQANETAGVRECAGLRFRGDRRQGSQFYRWRWAVFGV